MLREQSNTTIIRMLGARLKQYRLNLNMTQKELADITNVSVPTIQKFESGTSTNITLNNLLTLMRHTGLIEYADKLIPEQPESPYARKNPTRVRHNGHQKEK